MDSKIKPILLLAGILLVFFSLSSVVFSTPDGVTVNYVANYTKAATTGTIGNATNDGYISGGYIFVTNLNGQTQNSRWKAFVGNISGTLTLDDASGETIYDWSIATISGEVYATRHSTSINWTGINCAPLNATENEAINLSNTGVDDNISATFDGIDNQAMVVGTNTITANTCRTINVYQNSADTGGGDDVFEEIVLHDKGNASLNISDMEGFGNIVYAQNFENNEVGFNASMTFDFQLIVPERGSVGWASSTAYYFYIELG